MLAHANELPLRNEIILFINQESHQTFLIAPKAE